MFNPITFIAGSAVALAVGFAGGWQVQAWRQGAQQVKVITHTITVTKTLGEIATKAGVEAQAAHDRIVYRTNTIIQRVPYEIPPASDVVLPAGFLRLYNASLGLPEGPGGPAEPASVGAGLQASVAIPVIAGNNGQCLAGWDAYQRLLTFYDDVRAQVNGG